MFIVQCRDMATMRLSYYTGRAGAGWLSSNRGDAFAYATEGEAKRKMDMFRRQHPRMAWMAAHANPDDAHAAGAAAMSQEMCG